jgi:hypothetical protein
MRQKRFAKIELDKERVLRYSLNAISLYEEKTGEPLAVALRELTKHSFKAIRRVIWAGLLHEDPELTEEQVGEMIEFDQIQGLVVAINSVLGTRAPAIDRPMLAESPETDPLNEPIGTDSGVSADTTSDLAMANFGT